MSTNTNQSDLAALAACPFCGKAAEFDPPAVYSGAPVFTVRCCIADTGMCFSKEAAIKKWNRRALAARLPDGPAIQPLGPRHYTEQDVRQALSELQREFEQRAAPFLKVLCDIEARKPPRPFFIAAAPAGGQHGK